MNHFTKPDTFLCATILAMATCLLFASIGTSQEKSLNPNAFSSLTVLPKVFRAAEEKFRPCLVVIESFGGTTASQGKIGGIRSQGEGNTTGVMISPDGLIVTSTFNFVSRPPVITVIPSDGQRRVAKLLGQDHTRKICLLKIEDAENLPVPEFVSPDEVQVGQWALSIGVGYGDMNPAMSIGIVSAKNRIGGRAIQTDANISPANYGGPLIDLQGRLIGVCVPLSPNSQAAGSGVEWYDSGIGFAIPLAGADGLIKRLKDSERIDPAFLGIRSMTNPDGDGVWVVEAVKGSAAHAAEVKREDVITHVDDRPIPNPVALATLLTQHESGQTVKLTIVREGESEPLNIEVTLGSPPPPKGKPKPLALPLKQ